MLGHRVKFFAIEQSLPLDWKKTAEKAFQKAAQFTGAIYR